MIDATSAAVDRDYERHYDTVKICLKCGQDMIPLKIVGWPTQDTIAPSHIFNGDVSLHGVAIQRLPIFTP